MATNPLGLEYPEGADAFQPHTDIQALADSARGRVIVPVASEAVRDALETALPPSTAEPLYVFRADAPAGREIEYTTDGTTWRTLVAAGSSDQKELSASPNPTSTTNVTMPSLDMTAQIRSTSDVLWVDICAEVDINTAGTINVIEVLIDGVAEGVQLRTEASAGNNRGSGYKKWRKTGLSAGAHTIEFRTRNLAGSTSATITATMTSASYWVE
jgi:hypothetical protein